MMEEESSGQSRLFVILAIALIGLLVLGLLGIGGVFVIRQNIDEQSAASQSTPTLFIRLPKPTATFTPTPLATNTPQPTPTNTPVLSAGSSGEEAASGQSSEQGAQSSPTPKPSPTRTAVPNGQAAGAEVVPETGLGGLEAVLITAGLVAVLFIARRLRTS